MEIQLSRRTERKEKKKIPRVPRDPGRMLQPAGGQQGQNQKRLFLPGFWPTYRVLRRHGGVGGGAQDVAGARPGGCWSSQGHFLTQR